MKKFFDVFPTLKTESDVQALFEEVEVMKVVSTSSMDYLKIHISSTHLIPKKEIFCMEQRIKEQLFAKAVLYIKIIEDYQLSRQYTAENLMREYRESMLDELREESVLEANMFRKATCEFEEEGTLLLTLEDTIVAREKEQKLVAYLHGVFEDRCHIPLRVNVGYKEAKESKMKQHNEMQLNQEVNAILEKNARIQEEQEARRQAEGEKQEKERARQAEQEARRQQAAYTYTPKKPDDPNLVYGRDFEEEPIELEKVVTEMGEIVIRGKVLTVETK